MSTEHDMRRLARSLGVWTTEDIRAPAGQEDQANEPPRRKPGRQRSSPEQSAVADPAIDSKPIA